MYLDRDMSLQHFIDRKDVNCGQYFSRKLIKDAIIQIEKANLFHFISRHLSDYQSTTHEDKTRSSLESRGDLDDDKMRTYPATNF